MAEEIEVGSRVIAPLGCGEVAGTVVRVADGITVDLEVDGVDGPFLVTFGRADITAVSPGDVSYA
ncbi:hypothetical protein [Actinokineospora sp. UTMC 2448]|uniref:hypothetical protein n=1 Tax=Actinokineospora sp. UTMC 2448 TaxID=2268449 RepID=UPI00216460F9|nr:hypothetical protein [Actinokineospora sp. UTMC 2448]UVS81883.1 hypothetical protein Actkin_05647 [Actinokineospora sp. UTMC 2448]